MHDICVSQNISEKYASRLIIALRDGGLIVSVRGAKGGLKLKKLPKDITILEVIEVMEGKISVVDCVECPLSCKRSENCMPRMIWSNLNDTIRKTLSASTLQDIIDKNTVETPDNYCI